MNATYYWITSIILGIMVFVSIILNQREGINKLRRKLNNRIKAVIRLRGELEEARADILRLESSLGCVLPLHVEIVEKLCLLYCNRDKESDSRNETLSELYGIVERMVADDKFMERVEWGVNLRNDSIMVRFREDFPKLNDWEYDLMTCYVAGFTARTIGVLMKVEAATVHKRKANLKRKITESGCENRVLYLEWI